MESTLSLVDIHTYSWTNPLFQKQPCGAETMIFQVGKSGIYLGRVDFTFRAGKVVAWSGKLVDLRET